MTTPQNLKYKSVLQTIADNTHDHSIIINGTAMCKVLKHRLLKKGIMIPSISACLDVHIESEYGATLLDVYNMFDRAAPHFLKRQQDIEYEHRLEVKQECNIEFMFYRGIKQWAETNAPDVLFEGCYSNALLYRETPTNCTAINNASKLHYNFEILPFDTCIDALDQLGAQRMKVEEEHRIQRELPVSLGMEIAQIWRYQMPSRLENISKIIDLKYP
jgi:hypothetical protein